MSSSGIQLQIVPDVDDETENTNNEASTKILPPPGQSEFELKLKQARAENNGAPFMMSRQKSLVQRRGVSSGIPIPCILNQNSAPLTSTELLQHRRMRGITFAANS